ncbi:kinase-like domain-containing protein [Rhizophagus irregularis DAOM 181602=DAOM 197198]|nr:kinase-like domain-containing protein [Rhizophagus irregularis DAOM 181602=DAOM 197198]
MELKLINHDISAIKNNIKCFKSSDLFIHLSTHSKYEAIFRRKLEWIPYNKFCDVKYIVVDMFKKMYRAKWINKRNSVFLKSLDDPNNVTPEFVTSITVLHEIYGITQVPKTKTFMLVLNEMCEKCNIICSAMHYQQNFENWTSGNNDIDKYIQNTQLLAHVGHKNSLEWIPYDRFYDFKYVAEGKFGKTYKANWTDGNIRYWYSNNWIRENPNMLVFLKSLKNLKDITLELNEITVPHKFYGITQDPKTNTYMAVLNNPNNITSEYINEISKHYEVYGITQDPETKNYMMIYNEVCGKCGFANVYSAEWAINGQHNKLVALKSLNNSKNITLEFMNEIALHNKIGNSFSIIDFHDKNYNELSWDDKLLHLYYISSGLVSIHKNVISGLPPYHDVSHDKNLAIKICQGLRPKFNIKVPQLIVHLIKKCLEANPLNRPTADEIEKILCSWRDNRVVELQKQIKEAEEMNNKLLAGGIHSTNLRVSYRTHSEAIYTSRLLNFDNLPKPKNSDYYYEKKDTSMNSIESSAPLSLQIDVSKLNINYNNNPAKSKNSDLQCHYYLYKLMSLKLNIGWNGQNSKFKDLRPNISLGLIINK